jgi:diketogulonate reductase-like aldo/keto reductase
MIDKKQLSKLGIGTWGMGGLADKNPHNDDKKQIDALTYTLDKNINFAEICFWYAEGRSVELFKQALDKSSKTIDDIFLSVSLYQHRNPTIETVEFEFNKIREIFGTTQLDNTLITFSGIKVWGYDKTLDFLHKIIERNLTRYVSITNSNLDMLKTFKKEFDDKFFDHELTYSFEIRENEDMGITTFAKENNIRNVVWQPLRRNSSSKRNWPLLAKLAKKYNKTQNQIILNWLVTKGFLPLIKSENIKHIDENLESLNFKLETTDIDHLNLFRPTGWITPEIDWDKTGVGVSVSQLPTIFENTYAGY